MIGAIDRFPDNLLEPARHLSSIKTRSRGPGVQNLVLMGMGGSASAADVALDWLGNEIHIPAVIHRDRNLPRFVGPKTLFVAISYSGQTLETLTAFREARRRGSMLVGIGSGGKLASICKSFNVPFVKVATTVASRAALGQLMVAAGVVLESQGLVHDTLPEIVRAGRELVRLRSRVRAEVPSLRNPAKRLASLLKGQFVVTYSLQRMSSVARRFKNQLAENSKVASKYDVLPEAGHNEVEAWHRQSLPLLPLIIRDWKESAFESAIVRAFSSTIGNANSTKPLEVRLTAHGRLSRLLSPILFLDYVSVYLALLRGIDPTPTPFIVEYKRK